MKTSLLILPALMLLFSCGNPTKNRVPETDMHAAIVLDDVKTLKQHLRVGTDPDVREASMGSSPLITAAIFGRTEMTRLLLEAGADVNLQNSQGSTALHSATFLCHTEIVELLLAHGADRELKTIWGSTALQSVSAPFESVKGIYEQFASDLGPLGLRLDYAHIEKTRPVIASLLQKD